LWFPVSFQLPAALEVALHGTTNDTLGWYSKGGGLKGDNYGRLNICKHVVDPSKKNSN